MALLQPAVPHAGVCYERIRRRLHLGPSPGGLEREASAGEATLRLRDDPAQDDLTLEEAST